MEPRNHALFYNYIGIYARRNRFTHQRNEIRRKQYGQKRNKGNP